MNFNKQQKRRGVRSKTGPHIWDRGRQFVTWNHQSTPIQTNLPLINNNNILNILSLSTLSVFFLQKSFSERWRLRKKWRLRTSTIQSLSTMTCYDHLQWNLFFNEMLSNFAGHCDRINWMPSTSCQMECHNRKFVAGRDFQSDTQEEIRIGLVIGKLTMVFVRTWSSLKWFQQSAIRNSQYRPRRSEDISFPKLII